MASLLHLWQRNELSYHATAMSGAIGHPSALRCSHCGRAVAETMHTRGAYRVDYYSLHTGDVEPTTIQRGEEEPVTVLRLLSRRDVVTCAECYRQPRVRQQRDVLFRPEQGERALPIPA
jgi:hypothetical protein